MIFDRNLNSSKWSLERFAREHRLQFQLLGEVAPIGSAPGPFSGTPNEQPPGPFGTPIEAPAPLVPQTQYEGGPGLGGAAGLYAYNPQIAPPPPAFQAPVFSNSMSNWLGGSIADLPSAYASPMEGISNAAYISPFENAVSQSMGIGSDYVASGGMGLYQPNWDPQGTAYNMMFNNQINPYLGASNLNRIANFVNESGQFGNPNAGTAMASVSGAESSGNPWAKNPSSGATGMFQWMNTPGSPRLANSADAMNALGGWSPENQAAYAMGEITTGGYPGVYSTLNNPRSSMGQMQGALINQFEGLQDYPSQARSDVAGANAYLPAISSVGFNPAGHR